MANTNPSNNNSSEVERLIAAARDVEVMPDQLPEPDSNNGPLVHWLNKLVDKVGRFAIPVGFGAALLGFGLSSIGPEWAWASLLFLVTTVLFIIYIPYLLRSNARRRAIEIRQARQRQEEARAQVARLVLEQSQREEKAIND